MYGKAGFRILKHERHKNRVESLSFNLAPHIKRQSISGMKMAGSMFEALIFDMPSILRPRAIISSEPTQVISAMA